MVPAGGQTAHLADGGYQPTERELAGQRATYHRRVTESGTGPAARRTPDTLHPRGIEAEKTLFIEVEKGRFRGIAERITNQYTPQRARLGKPPKLVFGMDGKPSHVTGDNKELHIRVIGNQQERQWSELSIPHEFEHWHHAAAIKKIPALKDEIKNAAEQDWNQLKRAYRGRLDKLKYDDICNHLTRKIFDKDFYSTTLEEQNTIISISDSVGSIANGGGYGRGHSDYTGQVGRQLRRMFGTVDYYKIQNAHGLAFGEALANVKSLLATGMAEETIREYFPNILEIVKRLDIL